LTIRKRKNAKSCQRTRKNPAKSLKETALGRPLAGRALESLTAFESLQRAARIRRPPFEKRKRQGTNSFELTTAADSLPTNCN
jgi:hypothetical protein